MEIKQLEPKDKVLTFFGEFKSATVESAIKKNRQNQHLRPGIPETMPAVGHR